MTIDPLAGWASTTLGEVFVWSSGGTPTSTNPEFYGGTIPWAIIGDLNDSVVYETGGSLTEKGLSNSSAKLVSVGSVLLAMYGSIGKAGIAGVPLSTNQAIAFTNPDPINTRYLFWYLKHKQRELAERGKGATQKNISQTVLKAFPFSVAPLSEQKRIVEKIDLLVSNLDAGIAALARSRANLKRYRAAVLKAAVEGRLTAAWRAAHPDVEPASKLLDRILAERRRRWEEKQLARYAEGGKAPPKEWRDRYPEAVKPNLEGLPELPTTWCWATVDQVASGDRDSITDGPFGSNLKSEHYTEIGPRVIRLQNIGDGVFVDADAHITQERYERLQKHAVHGGDMVVAMLGEILPRACIVPDYVVPAIVKADCAKVSLDGDLCMVEYGNCALNSDPARKRAAGSIKGVGRPRLNLSHIRAIPIPLPPMPEQMEICATVSQALEISRHEERELERATARSDALRQSILKRAFEGKLVPQDPNDEPAAVLLERIRAARAQAPADKGGRGKRAGAVDNGLSKPRKAKRGKGAQG